MTERGCYPWCRADAPCARCRIKASALNEGAFVRAAAEMSEWTERQMKRASGEPASRAAQRLIGATLPPMATTEEKLLEEAVTLLSPLTGLALVAVVDVVRLLVSHPDGAELAAKRNAQALAAEAFIRS